MTSSEDVLLREVDDDLQQDKQLEFLKKYGPALGVAGLLVVAWIGAYSYLSSASQRAAEDAAQRYYRATSVEAATPEFAAEAMQAAIPTLTSGYQAVAHIRAGGLLANAGDVEGAMAEFAAVVANQDVPERLRDFARLKSAVAQLDTDAAAALELASGVTTEALLPFAQELRAWAAIKSDDYETAAEIFNALAADPAVPLSLRDRAQTYAPLAEAGAAGVPLVPAEASENSFIESFASQLGEPLPDDRIAPDAEPFPVDEDPERDRQP